MTIATRDTRSFGELTLAVLGRPMTVDQAFELLELEPTWGNVGRGGARPASGDQLWVGSIGYERYRMNTDFAARLRDADVERLIDVRQLPISRRRGYAKSALGETLAAHGIDYVHMRDLGNPKPIRDLYKSGRAEEGRTAYERYLLNAQREALDVLADRLVEKRCALMCVEHDAAVCHRSVIFDALRVELGLALELVEIG